MALLEVQDLHVSVGGKDILKGLSLTVDPGRVHAIMGPNGAGKSTLGYTIAGRDGYEVVSGDILLDGKSILEMAPEERSIAGLFLALQYPVEIPGVPTTAFLKAALNARRKAEGQDEIDAIAFAKLVRSKAEELDMDVQMLKRPVNVGFSGGEKKRVETLQMSMLEPRMAVLDETDSGLDIDALRVVSDGVNRLRSDKRGFLVITHYQRLLNYIVPDVVHVLVDGRIVETGGKELAERLEAEGYARFQGSEAA